MACKALLCPSVKSMDSHSGVSSDSMITSFENTDDSNSSCAGLLGLSSVEFMACRMGSPLSAYCRQCQKVLLTTGCHNVHKLDVVALYVNGSIPHVFTKCGIQAPSLQHKLTWQSSHWPFQLRVIMVGSIAHSHIAFARPITYSHRIAHSRDR